MKLHVFAGGSRTQSLDWKSCVRIKENEAKIKGLDKLGIGIPRVLFAH